MQGSMQSIILLVLVVLVWGDDFVVKQTKLGNIRGLLSSVDVDNQTYTLNIFKNIPYAKPPIGNHRFMEPVPYGNWSDTLDATRFGPSCIQPPTPSDNMLPNLNQSEDCLQLNIYVPTNTTKNYKKSVMVWVHGGGYAVGQAMLYDASYLAALGDVIVVTINYRLNIFGFFTTNDVVAPGNYGLWDQRLAFIWVKNNIDSYGGDPNTTTIFGESAGGFSVGLQAINPKNAGLFKRVIAQSGVSNTLLATSPLPRLAAVNLAQILNCSSKLDNNTLSCLRNKTTSEIMTAYGKLTIQTLTTPDVHIFIGFAPVVDGNFLTDTPQNVIAGKGAGFEFYKSLDVIIGNCESEGSLLVYALQKRNYTLQKGIPSNYMCKHIVPTLSTDYFHNNTRIINPICDKYQTKGSISQQSMSAVNFYGDIFMYSPAVQSLNAHANHSTQSHYQYLSKRYSIWSDSQKAAKWFVGSGHSSELPFLFPFTPLSNATNDDKSNSINFITYWSNFAKTGNVNGNGVLTWPKYDTVNKTYALIDANVTIEQNLYKDRMDFWLKDFPKLLNTNTTTIAPVTNPVTHKPNGDGSPIHVVKHRYLLLFAVFVLSKIIE